MCHLKSINETPIFICFKQAINEKYEQEEGEGIGMIKGQLSPRGVSTLNHSSIKLWRGERISTAK